MLRVKIPNTKLELHPHPKMEEQKGIDKDHVIIDRNVFEYLIDKIGHKSLEPVSKKFADTWQKDPKCDELLKLVESAESNVDVSRFEQQIMRIFAVTEIKYEFDWKREDWEQLEKYFIEKRRDYVLQLIIKNKIDIGSYLIFLEPEQESGVWHIKLTEIKYWCERETEGMPIEEIKEKTLSISVDLVTLSVTKQKFT
jgi:hypothetical protein